MNFEINQKIAKLYGWTNVRVYSDNSGPDILCGDPPSYYTKRHKYDQNIPDYSNDLNAIHSVLNRLIEIKSPKMIDFYKNLKKITKKKKSSELLHADAQQICNTLTLTFNL